MIERYEFGKIVIDGKVYDRDLIVFWDGRVYDNWWRKSGHLLVLEDIKDLVLPYDLEVLVVGCGYMGVLKVDDALKRFLAERGIKLIDEVTQDAVKEFNSLKEAGKRVVGCFHLTC